MANNINIISENSFWENENGNLTSKIFRPTLVSSKRVNGMKNIDGRMIVTPEGRMFYDNGENRIELGNAGLEYVELTNYNDALIESAKEENKNKIYICPQFSVPLDDDIIGGDASTPYQNDDMYYDGGEVGVSYQGDSDPSSIFTMVVNGQIVGTKTLKIDTSLYATKENFSPTYITSDGTENNNISKSKTIAFGNEIIVGSNTLGITNIENGKENTAIITTNANSLPASFKEQIIGLSDGKNLLRPYCGKITSVNGSTLTIDIIDDQGNLPTTFDTATARVIFDTETDKGATTRGSYIFALGNNLYVPESYGFALGNENKIGGLYSCVQGINNKVGQHGAVFGSNNWAKGKHQLVFGTNNEVSYSHNLVFGDGNKTSKHFNLTIGKGINNDGNYSIAIGDNAGMAAGEDQFAIGSTHSFGMGTNVCVATGSPYSFAFGNNVAAQNTYSFAFGEASQANGEYSFAFGQEAKVYGMGSFAFGTRGHYSDGESIPTLVHGEHSIAIGSACAIGTSTENETSNYSGAFGFYNIVKPGADYSYLLGASNWTNKKYTYMLGHGLRNDGGSEDIVILGKYNTEPADDDLLVVGNGTSNSDRKNAFEIQNNGNTIFSGNIYLTGGDSGRLILNNRFKDGKPTCFIRGTTSDDQGGININDEIVFGHGTSTTNEEFEGIPVLYPKTDDFGRLGYKDHPWKSIHVKEIVGLNKINDLELNNFYMDSFMTGDTGNTVSHKKTITIPKVNRAFFLVGIATNGGEDPALFIVNTNVWSTSTARVTKIIKISGNSSTDLTSTNPNTNNQITLTIGADLANVFIIGSWC